MTGTPVRRGEVWTVSGGADYAGKPRPAVVVQNDLYATRPSTTLCGLTTAVTESPVTRPLIEPGRGNGLSASSRVMVDKVTTVQRTRLGRRIGRLNDAEMARVDEALILFLGLAG